MHASPAACRVRVNAQTLALVNHQIGNAESHLAHLIHKGVARAAEGDLPQSAAAFLSAHREAPFLGFPLYNAGIVRRCMGETEDAEDLFSKALATPGSQGGRWWVDRARHELALCGAMRTRSVPNAAGEMIQVVAGAGRGALKVRVWAQICGDAVAQIRSIPRYGDGYADKVYYTYDPMLCGPDGERFGAEGLCVVQTAALAAYRTFEVRGPEIDRFQGCQLAEASKSRGLPLEVWSFTVCTPPQTSTNMDPCPLVAGVAVQGGRAGCREAAQTLRQVGADLRLALWFPDLLAEAGDELGAARHRRAVRGAG